MTEVKRQFQHK